MTEIVLTTGAVANSCIQWLWGKNIIRNSLHNSARPIANLNFGRTERRQSCGIGRLMQGFWLNQYFNPMAWSWNSLKVPPNWISLSPLHVSSTDTEARDDTLR